MSGVVTKLAMVVAVLSVSGAAMANGTAPSPTEKKAQETMNTVAKTQTGKKASDALRKALTPKSAPKKK